MDNQQINRAVNAILREVKEYEAIGITPPGHIRDRFVKMYNCDPQFKQMSKGSVLIMLRLNVRYRWILLHVFGSEIDLCGNDPKKQVNAANDRVHELKFGIEEDY